ncbi:SatD family protein [Flavobacterium sp.]|uniref:SatD family protein n=1 Tax=Flavobacterium sp. TaxID=239 RepID=UPI003C3A5569
MVAVITGDIIQSRKSSIEIWMPKLKAILSEYGNSPKDWEIFRGDSFQMITTPEQALYVSMIIKAELKKNDNIDVRVGIGIGEINFRTNKVTESNGSAFVHSGSSFDGLKKQTLAIQTPWKEWNKTFLVMIDLAIVIIEKWSEKTAEVMAVKLKNPSMSQKEIAEVLNKKGQGNISESLKRGGYDELNQLLNYYQETIKKLC